MSSSAPARVPTGLRSLVAGHLEVDEAELQADALLGEDLGVDSLAAIEMAMVLEDTYAIRLPDDVLSAIQTYADLEAAVTRALGG